MKTAWRLEIDFGVVLRELPDCFRIPQTTRLNLHLMAVKSYWAHFMDLLLQFLKMVVIDMILDNRQSPDDETKWGLDKV